MLTFVEIALLLGTLGFVAYPLASKKYEGVSDGILAESALSDLLYRKEAAYIALSDLKFDHETGKIGEADYMEMKSRFEDEAVAILASIDDLSKARPVEKQQGKAQKAENFCPYCGANVKTDHRFCHKCGKEL